MRRGPISSELSKFRSHSDLFGRNTKSIHWLDPMRSPPPFQAAVPSMSALLFPRLPLCSLFFPSPSIYRGVGGGGWTLGSSPPSSILPLNGADVTSRQPPRVPPPPRRPLSELQCSLVFALVGASARLTVTSLEKHAVGKNTFSQAAIPPSR